MIGIDDDDRLIDPDCGAGKHAACAGSPCECPCHEGDAS